MEHKPAKNMTVRVDGYNLLGLIDDKYNKTLYGFNEFADYRASSPAVGISMLYKFWAKPRSQAGLTDNT